MGDELKKKSFLISFVRSEVIYSFLQKVVLLLFRF